MSQFSCFLAPNALAINQARQEHLDSLGLPILQSSRVLEVGAGIGLHTGFFIDKGCDVVSTDGRADNVEEIRRRWPGIVVQQVDLEKETSLKHLGTFDIVYCYGLLYHVGDPERVLAMLAQVCEAQILLELIVNQDQASTLYLTNDPNVNDQSTIGKACRPSRAWILDRLNQYWGHGYITVTQPNHAEFPTDWNKSTNLNTRAIFVGSRMPLINPSLSQQVTQTQVLFTK
jgi:SAM-dependent methyltransferase